MINFLSQSSCFLFNVCKRACLIASSNETLTTMSSTLSKTIEKAHVFSSRSILASLRKEDSTSAFNARPARISFSSRSRLSRKRKRTRERRKRKKRKKKKKRKRKKERKKRETRKRKTSIKQSRLVNSSSDFNQENFCSRSSFQAEKVDSSFLDK